jgi:hypothetical protein
VTDQQPLGDGVQKFFQDDEPATEVFQEDEPTRPVIQLPRPKHFEIRITNGGDYRHTYILPHRLRDHISTVMGQMVAEGAKWNDLRVDISEVENFDA